MVPGFSRILVVILCLGIVIMHLPGFEFYFHKSNVMCCAKRAYYCMVEMQNVAAACRVWLWGAAVPSVM